MNDNVALRYGILAVATHAVVIALSLSPSLRSQPIVSGDAITYIINAENIVHHGTFSREHSPPFLWEPYRTPGYPLAIAGCIAAFGTASAVLFLGAITAGLAAWSAARLTALFGGSHTAIRFAGAVTAFLPNSLGLSAMMLTDAIAGHLTLVWLYALIVACWKRSLSLLLASALLLMVLQLLKPTFNIAGLLVFVVVLLFYKGKYRSGLAAALMIFSLVLPVYFASRNEAAHGIQSASLLGMETAREYLYVRYLHEMTGEDYTLLTQRIREEDRRDAERLSTPTSTYGRLYVVKEDKVKRFVREHPLAALRLMGTEMMQQFAAPQEFFPQVFVGDLPNWGRAIGTLLTLVLWVSGFFGSYVLWKSGDKRPALLLACVLAYFLATGSISHFVGARLRFPADMVAAPFAAIGLSQWRSISRWNFP